MPSTIVSSAPGIVRASERPDDGRTRGSSVPWTTIVGAVTERSLRLRSPEALIA